jgi:hypothetical protein
MRVAFSGEWCDLLGSIEDAQGAAALVREAYTDGTDNSGYLMRFFTHDVDEEIQLGFQLNHDVLIPGEARLHVHVVPMSVPVAGVSDVVRWKYYYTLAAVNGAVIPRASASWTTSTISQTLATTSQYKHIAQSIVSIPIPAGTPSSSILVRVIRPGATDAADTYSVNKAVTGGTTVKANLGLIGLDVHVQRASAGTRGEFS